MGLAFNARHCLSEPPNLLLIPSSSILRAKTWWRFSCYRCRVFGLPFDRGIGMHWGKNHDIPFEVF